MKRINMLDEQVYIRIAAGEVVANPAAVVKELCENSIDAGASAISVEIKEGGKKYIRVSDNGSGIYKEDILLSIEKHATSKISALDDLYNISTMGFRGEALASISAVSNFTLSSRTKDSLEGSVIRVYEGTKTVEYAGLPEGTSITCENLFYNIPARLKFLKNTTRETVGVTNIVAKLILSNPDVSFKYINNGKLVYQSPGNSSLSDAIISVYDSSVKNKVKEVRYEGDDIFITGYISSPNFLYKSAANIYIFVNNRYIKSKSIQNQIIHSYGERLLKAHYPLAVINIQIPYNLADVNVHPNKLEIMFDDETQVLHCVDIALRRALDNLNAPIMNISSANSCEGLSYEPISEETAQEDESNLEQVKPQLPDIKSSHTLYEKRTALSQSYMGSSGKIADYIGENNYENSNLIDAKDIFDIKDFEKLTNTITRKQEQQSLPLSEIANYKLIGQIFETYIIIESNNCIYIVDQHAAHERILFEQLKTQINTQSQTLLISHIMKLNHGDFELIISNMEILKECGFDIEEFGALSVKVNAIPLTIGDNCIETLVNDVISELKTTGKIILLREKLIRAACRHSIKANQPLSDAQIKEIIKEITSQDIMPNCPHGRPIAVCITKEELEKGFKRIL